MLVMGDSLSAEYGIQRGAGWVALLRERVAQRKFSWQVVNASVSGETTAGGASRLAPMLATYRPRIVIVELGANDALRGLSLAAMQKNLVSMIDASKASGARVLLVGMRIPPNYGRRYADDFAGSFANLAKEKRVAFTPFLLDGLADDNVNFQSDRLHPTEPAQTQLMENVWKQLEPLLRKP